MNGKVVGIVAAVALLAIVIGGGVVYKNKDDLGVQQEVRLETVEPVVWATQEVYALCMNEEVRKLLRDLDKVKPKCELRSTGEITSKVLPDGVDVGVPASDVAARAYVDKFKPPRTAQITLVTSPIIVLANKDVRDAFVAKGYAAEEPGRGTVLDADKFVSLLRDRVKWKDIGVNEHGTVTAITTAVATTSSGQGTVNLLGALANGGEPVTPENAEVVGAKIKPLVDRFGTLPMTSAELFAKCFRLSGCGALSIGFENAYLRYLIENPGTADKANKVFSVMYLKPGIFGNHTAFTATDAGDRFVKAFMRPEVQRAAGKLSGFRSLLNDVDTLSGTGIQGVASKLGTAIPSPLPAAQTALINAALGKAPAAPTAPTPAAK